MTDVFNEQAAIGVSSDGDENFPRKRQKILDMKHLYKKNLSI